MLLKCGVGEDSWESLGLQRDQTSQSQRTSVLNILWKDWCWSWSSNTLATWCEELTHIKRPWCWERLKAGVGDDRGWDGWMATLTQWTWVSVTPGVDIGQGGLACCDSWGRKELDTTEWLIWSDLIWFRCLYLSFFPLLFTSLLFAVICKASLDSYFAFSHFFSMGMVLIPVFCAMSWTSFHSSSGTLSIRSSPLNLFLLPLCNHKGFDLGHTWMV